MDQRIFLFLVQAMMAMKMDKHPQTMPTLTPQKLAMLLSSMLCKRDKQDRRIVKGLH